MDRPRPIPEPLEPDEPANSRSEPHDQPATSSSAPEETQPHRRTDDATSAADGTDAAHERDDDKAESTTVARSADNSPETDRDISAQLPAKLREEMRRDPTFTRLGWGIDETSMPTNRSETGNDHAADTAPHRESGHQASAEALDIAASGNHDAPRAGGTQEALADFDRRDDQAEAAEVDESESAQAADNADETVLEAKIEGDRAAPAEPADDRATVNADGARTRGPSEAAEPEGDEGRTDGQIPAAADSEFIDTKEAATDEQPAKPIDDGWPAKATDVAVPAVKREGPGDGSLDVLDGIPGGADQHPDAADHRPVADDTRSADQSIRAIFERWDAEDYKMPRPLDPQQAADPEPEVPGEPEDRRAADERNGVAYIATHKDSKPWLGPAASCEPVVQSIYASIDLTGGHAHIRHGPMGTDQMYANRAAFNEDPAQSDPIMRAEGIDGIAPPKKHYCARESTRIHDVNAFAAAYVGVLEYPAVKAALEEKWVPGVQLDQIPVPIVELLGVDGHTFCSGFRLKGDWGAAKAARKQWTQARTAGEDLTGLTKPEVERIATFEGGDILVTLKGSAEKRCYEILSMWPQPADPPRSTTKGNSDG
jgi:hypothetical protein